MSNIRKCVAIHFEWESHGREANATSADGTDLFFKLKKIKYYHHSIRFE